MTGSGPNTSEWRVWSTTASVAVTDTGSLRVARELVQSVVAEVDAACSRFRPDSELARITGRTSAGVEVSPLLAALVRTALEAAALTAGDVDPAVGHRLIELGYDRDIEELRDARGVPVGLRRLPSPRFSWRDVHLCGTTLAAPDEVVLDLGATAKAFAADRAAGRVASSLGCGVLVSLGGDIATAGAREDGPWQVLVEDVPGDPRQQVSLTPGWAIATSSTQKRRWLRDGRSVHHILDPRSGLPAAEMWRSATVAAPTCVAANTLSTAAIVRGPAAGSWLAQQGAAARLVDSARHVHRFGGWPEAADDTEGALLDVR